MCDENIWSDTYTGIWDNGGKGWRCSSRLSEERLGLVMCIIYSHSASNGWTYNKISTHIKVCGICQSNTGTLTLHPFKVCIKVLNLHLMIIFNNVNSTETHPLLMHDHTSWSLIQQMVNLKSQSILFSNYFIISFSKMSALSFYVTVDVQNEGAFVTWLSQGNIWQQHQLMPKFLWYDNHVSDIS